MNKRYYAVPGSTTYDLFLVVDDPPQPTKICSKDLCYTREYKDGPNIPKSVPFEEITEEEAVKLVLIHGLLTTPND